MAKYWVAVLALVVRLVVIVAEPSPVLEANSKEYFSLASHLRFERAFSYGVVHTWGGDVRLAPGGGDLHLTSDRAPLYPLLIASLWGADVPVRRVQVVNALLGSGSVGLVSLMGGPWAGLAMAFWPRVVAGDVDLLSEPLFTFVLLLAVYLWVKHRFVGAGVLIGLAVLTRLTLLPWLLVSPLLVLKRRELGVIGVTALLVIAPWTLRNAIQLHRFVPVATAGSGANVFLGTMKVPLWSGANSWEIFSKDLEGQRILAEGREDYETEALMRVAGVKRIWGNPFQWLINRSLQLVRFFVDPGGLYVRGVLRWPMKIFAIGSSLVLLVGFIARIRRAPFPVLAVWCAMVAVYVPTYAIEMRFGAPLVPLMLIGAFRSHSSTGRGESM
ncbi:MAG: hypothetical protein LBQ09_00290 [Acidobacteriaceae bacterium]|jgi:hypothetical protein|nr:hypothetical protein [Acidobacteriaceae bacterium]